MRKHKFSGQASPHSTTDLGLQGMLTSFLLESGQTTLVTLICVCQMFWVDVLNKRAMTRLIYTFYERILLYCKVLHRTVSYNAETSTMHIIMKKTPQNTHCIHPRSLHITTLVKRTLTMNNKGFIIMRGVAGSFPSFRHRLGQDLQGRGGEAPQNTTTEGEMQIP